MFRKAERSVIIVESLICLCDFCLATLNCLGSVLSLHHMDNVQTQTPQISMHEITEGVSNSPVRPNSENMHSDSLVESQVRGDSAGLVNLPVLLGNQRLTGYAFADFIEGKQSAIRAKGERFTNGCIICFDDFTREVEVSELPCGHVFHTKCVSAWLSSKETCPMCRHSVSLEP